MLFEMFREGAFRKHAWLWMIVFVVIALLFAHNTFAQWEELPSRGTTVDFALTANEKAQSIYGTAIHAGINYWFGLNGTQISHDGEVLSQDLNARLQGGFGFAGASLQGFVEANRDMDSKIATSTGAYLRRVIEMKKLAIVFGGGSFIERDQFAELDTFDKEGTETDAGGSEILPYYLLILGGEYDYSETIGLHGKVIGKPQANFASFGGVFDIGTDIVLNDQWTLKIQSTTEFEVTDGETETSTENSVILSLNF
ncbi:MAG: hypothetical protein OXH00_02735 [Candidatus Poribacteria bacterium]|nr:hypothetical protein [Candidatus Poribacteria bacterium]